MIATPSAQPLAATLSDEAIVHRVLAGEGAMFELLMRRHNQRLYRTIRAYLRNEAEVEEAMQQTYLEAYAHLAGFKRDSSFSTWLLRIGINEALMRLRREGRLSLVGSAPEGEDVMERVRGNDPDPEQVASIHEVGRLTEAAIDELPEAYRGVFVLREVEGMSTREVAEALELNEAAVKQRLHRAKERVREAVYSRLDRHLTGAFPFPATRCDRVVAAVLARLSISSR